MTPIEQKKLVSELRAHAGPLYNDMTKSDLWSALVAAADTIERHEAFRKEVSDAVEAYHKAKVDGPLERSRTWDKLARFIIRKAVDPLVEAIEQVNQAECKDAKEAANVLRKALAGRNLEIREIGE